MEIAVRHLKACDPVLGDIITRVGPCGMTYREPVFDTLVRSIVYQQLSGKVAKVIYDRLAATAPEGLTPASILKLRPSRMRKLGLSAAKTEYIRDLARRTRAGEIDFAILAAAPDENVIEILTQVKGIGVWTVQMFLIFALRRPDVLPTGDLGIRKAMQIAYKLPELPKPAEMERFGASWRPYCSVATWYLWRSLDGFAVI